MNRKMIRANMTLVAPAIFDLLTEPEQKLLRVIQLTLWKRGLDLYDRTVEEWLHLGLQIRAQGIDMKITKEEVSWANVWFCAGSMLDRIERLKRANKFREGETE